MSQTLANGLVPTAPPATGAVMAAEINKGFADARSMLRGTGRPAFLNLGDLWVWSNNGAGGEEIRMNRGGAVDFRLMTINSATGDITVPGHVKTVDLTPTAIRDLVKLADGAASGIDADLLDGFHADAFLRRDVNQTHSALLLLDNTASAEQIRVGSLNTGLDNYIAFRRNGLQTGFIQTLGGYMRFSAQGGAYLDLYDSGQARLNNGLIWHSLNDGAGSGLDADLFRGLAPTSFAQRAASQSITGLWEFSVAGSEQIRLGANTGATQSTFISFYDGLSTRRGYLQAQSTFMRLQRDGGARLELFGPGDARIDGDPIVTRDELGSRVAALVAGDVGTTVFAHVTGSTTYQYGSNVAGSKLRPASNDGTFGTQTFAGTWECMGRITATARTSNFRRITL